MPFFIQPFFVQQKQFIIIIIIIIDEYAKIFQNRK